MLAVIDWKLDRSQTQISVPSSFLSDRSGRATLGKRWFIFDGDTPFFSGRHEWRVTLQSTKRAGRNRRVFIGVADHWRRDFHHDRSIEYPPGLFLYKFPADGKVIVDVLLDVDKGRVWSFRSDAPDEDPFAYPFLPGLPVVPRFAIHWKGVSFSFEVIHPAQVGKFPTPAPEAVPTQCTVM